jgi:hypothetical protein
MANAVKLTFNERKTLVESLISTNACCWEESDRTTLNELSDVTLAKLYKQASLISNEGTPEELKEDSSNDVAVEEETTKEGESQADGKEKPIGELDPKAEDTPSMNALSSQDRQDLAFARGYRMKQRGQYIQAITSNANNKFTVNQLKSMNDNILANLSALAQNSNNREEIYTPNFFGQQGAGVQNISASEEPLKLGKINYKELASTSIK